MLIPHAIPLASRLSLALFLLITACSGAGGSTTGTQNLPPSGIADITLLFMGDSHTSFNRLPAMVAAMVRAARPGRTVSLVERARTSGAVPVLFPAYSPRQWCPADPL